MAITNHYCYLPLYIFSWGASVVGARLRPSNTDASAREPGPKSNGSWGRREPRGPEVRIILRADSGFCRGGPDELV